MSPSRSRPAASLPGLERWISEWADESTETASRLRRRIGVLALAAMLDRCVDEAGLSLFALKGGSALEMRFLADARVSRDVDLVYRGPVEAAVSSLSDAASRGWGPFTARAMDPEPLSIPWSDVAGARIEVKLRYAGKPYGTLALEVVTGSRGEVEYVDSVSLAPVGLEAPAKVPCLSLRYQIAEKFHACTDPLDPERVNDRAGDLMDLILIEDLVGPSGLDLPSIRSACVEVFRHRDRHPWPPLVVVQPTWPAIWAGIVGDHSFYVADVHRAAGRVNDFITAIEGSAPGRHGPGRQPE